MICSADELNLANDVRFNADVDGIIELPHDASVGEEFAVYANFDDALIEVCINAQY